LPIVIRCFCLAMGAPKLETLRYEAKDPTCDSSNRTSGRTKSYRPIRLRRIEGNHRKEALVMPDVDRSEFSRTLILFLCWKQHKLANAPERTPIFCIGISWYQHKMRIGAVSFAQGVDPTLQACKLMGRLHTRQKSGQRHPGAGPAEAIRIRRAKLPQDGFVLR
jgi:hypothetical protein